jgi:hypothetical protein
MKKYLKSFFHRGLIFGGFGPIVVAIIFFILSYTVEDFSLSGREVFLAVISTYLLAFLHAGASIFNQMEELSLAKATLLHFLTLYLAYTVCYLVNSWLEFKLTVLLIYTAIFAAVYLSVWLTVLITLRITQKRMNASLEKNGASVKE